MPLISLYAALKRARIKWQRGDKFSLEFNRKNASHTAVRASITLQREDNTRIGKKI